MSMIPVGFLSCACTGLSIATATRKSTGDDRPILRKRRRSHKYTMQLYISNTDGRNNGQGTFYQLAMHISGLGQITMNGVCLI